MEKYQRNFRKIRKIIFFRFLFLRLSVFFEDLNYQESTILNVFMLAVKSHLCRQQICITFCVTYVALISNQYVILIFSIKIKRNLREIGTKNKRTENYNYLFVNPVSPSINSTRTCLMSKHTRNNNNRNQRVNLLIPRNATDFCNHYFAVYLS